MYFGYTDLLKGVFSFIYGELVKRLYLFWFGLVGLGGTVASRLGNA